MTISSSLAAGVSGLTANASRLATISDNIANSSTYGYKRATTDFHSMVIGGNSGGSYAAGGIRVTTGREISERAGLVGTSNPTDLAVTGRGMLPVTTAGAVDGAEGDQPLRLTTTGSFRPDADGLLRSDNGLVLMGWPADAEGNVPNFPRDVAGGLEPVRIESTQFAGTPTRRVGLGVNLPATATEAGAPGKTEQLSIGYFGDLGEPESLDITYTPTVPANGRSNEWTMTIADPRNGGSVVGEYVLAFDDAAGSGGALASATQPAGAPGQPYDPAEGTVAVDIDGTTVEFAIGPNADGRTMTQLSDSFDPLAITKDGQPVSELVGVEVDGNGNLNALDDAGNARTLFQIPLVDVPNPDGLESLDNQTYGLSPDSGPFFLWTAGTGPTDEIAGASREESGTDVVEELTQMIQTQRAYSSNAKIIQTVDEMLQETTNLKR
ncbi:flagellar biosynthesis protein FlgE [Rhodobacteraceae bacterium WD3A24]|nr:flagellar biosynthesis protein FlgE [Rhodobacteraceae bacterium WD3A24]